MTQRLPSSVTPGGRSYQGLFVRRGLLVLKCLGMGGDRFTAVRTVYILTVLIIGGFQLKEQQNNRKFKDFKGRC